MGGNRGPGSIRELGSANQRGEEQRSREERIILCGHIGKKSREGVLMTSSPSSEGPGMRFSSHGGQGV